MVSGTKTMIISSSSIFCENSLDFLNFRNTNFLINDAKAFSVGFNFFKNYFCFAVQSTQGNSAGSRVRHNFKNYCVLKPKRLHTGMAIAKW